MYIILISSSPRMPWSFYLQSLPDFVSRSLISSVLTSPFLHYVFPYRQPCISPEPLSRMQEMTRQKQISFKMQFANSSLFAAYCRFLNNAQINFSIIEIINTGSKPGVPRRAQIKSCRTPTAGACLSLFPCSFDVLFSQVSQRITRRYVYLQILHCLHIIVSNRDKYCN